MSTREPLFGILIVPPDATHVRFHETNNGKMGNKIGIEVGDHIIHNFPIDELTKQWVVAHIGPGTYRLAWLAVDPRGKEQRLGASGNMTFADDETTRRKAGAPSATAAPVETVDQRTLPKHMREEMSVLSMYRQIQSECRAQEAADFQARTERDRVFFAYMIQLATNGNGKGALPNPDKIRERLERLEKGGGEAEAEEDDEGTSNFFVQMAKAFGKEIAPAIGPIVREAIAAKAVTP